MLIFGGEHSNQILLVTGCELKSRGFMPNNFSWGSCNSYSDYALLCFSNEDDHGCMRFDGENFTEDTPGSDQILNSSVPSLILINPVPNPGRNLGILTQKPFFWNLMKFCFMSILFLVKFCSFFYVDITIVYKLEIFPLLSFIVVWLVFQKTSTRPRKMISLSV